MSERKVLNKYYPPDFDPSKIPRLRLSRERQYTVRLMAPCNMRCTTCGEYIYKGKKFNARKETVQNEEYLGIKVFRFYIKCPRCLAEITFKTDPEKADYVVEHGATRNFQALKLAEEAAVKEAKELEEEEKNNPMKLLENRTQASKQEMELLETLAELKDWNQRHDKVNVEKLLIEKKQQLIDEVKRQEEEDEALVRTYFGKAGGETIKRIADEDEPVTSSTPMMTSIIETHEKKPKITTSIGISSKHSKDNLVKLNKMTSLVENPPKKPKITGASIGVLSKNSKDNLVKPKQTNHEQTIQTIQSNKTAPIASSSSTTTTAKPNALSLLGSYSDSDSS